MTGPKTDGKLGCFYCKERSAPQLMHRFTFRYRGTKPRWLCQRCWQRKFRTEGAAA